MSMISEQIDELRAVADGFAHKGIQRMARQAADTIEELSAKLANANMERSTAYYNDGWIPCSERLPSREEYQKCNGQFIVSDGNRTYATYFDIYDTLKFGEPTMDKFKVDKCVIAWMPLPTPYKPKGENNV